MTSTPTPPPTDPDHEAVAALLASDDWQRRLAAARAQRAKVLEQRARDGRAEPPPESRIDAARRQRLEGAGEPVPAQQRLLLVPEPRPQSAPEPKRMRMPTRQTVFAAAAAALVLLVALGLWLA